MIMKAEIYFEPNYGKLYETVEGGKSVNWRYEGCEGIVNHMFLFRKIPINLNDGDWFDIITPYGYGGPVIQEVRSGHQKKDLVCAFEKSFSEYCKEKRIVSEFVRFHPILNNAQDFVDVYHAEHIRNTVGTDLKHYSDPVAAEFSKSCRKTIRQAINKGVSWKITVNPQNLDRFREIYYATMDRNRADTYYYFDDTYFNNCQNFYGDHILLVEALYNGSTIAAGLYFIWNSTIHIHLSGTYSEYLFLSPAYILRYAVTLWGKEHGCELIHHGGGRSNSREDSLYLFKKQFGKNTEFDFFVGKKIWNQVMYDRFCTAAGKASDNDFFPAYRV